jgi:hypothetical protein
MPRLTAALIAALIAVLALLSTSEGRAEALMLMTPALRSIASAIPAARSSGADSPRSSKILMGMIGLVGEMPRTPPAAAAATDATAVPCPSMSFVLGVSVATFLPLRKRP